MASCTPWRATRKAVGTRILGSAVSDEVSLLVWMQATPRSRTTSCTANDADEASELTSSSQPAVFTSSRAMRAASWAALWIAVDEFDLSAEEAAGSVDAVLLHHQRVARGGAEQRNGPGQDVCIPIAMCWPVPCHPGGGQSWPHRRPTWCDA